MPITPLPTPVPSRADPANFAARGDAFLAALPAFATEANALATEVNENAAICESAAQTVNVTAWSSVTSYAVGANVYDATTLLTYRRKTVGSGGLRPGLNGTDWQLLTGFGNVDLSSTQTLTNKTHGSGSVWGGGAIPVANGGTGATTAANARTALGVDGTNFVTMAGNQTVAGVKTISSAPILSAGATFGSATLANVATSAPLFGARAFGVFDGRTTGTFACASSGNVTSVQRTAAGTYVVTLTTAMLTTDFVVVSNCRNTSVATYTIEEAEARTTTTFRLFTKQEASGAVDCAFVSFAVFRT